LTIVIIEVFCDASGNNLKIRSNEQKQINRQLQFFPYKAKTSLSWYDNDTNKNLCMDADFCDSYSNITDISNLIAFSSILG